MFGNNSISISVSDSDSDELGRMRVRVRRKRKKPGHRVKNELVRRVIRAILKYWTLLIFLPAAGLLVFEASRIGRKPSLVVNSELGAAKKPKSEGNLNRLDPTTRVVGGVRERCLKLLPLEELEHLDIPEGGESTSPVKKVLYMSENDIPFLEENTNLQRTGATRFNVFTGNQTRDQREKSFKVCYVAFWDEITLSAQESVGHRIGEDGFIGKWRIVVVQELPFTDQRLNGKIPKMLGHRLFPHAKYSIWVDSKSQFRRDPLGVLEALLWRSNSVLAISEHGARSSVYDEAKAVVKKNKATPEEVEVQLTQYHHDDFPEDKRFNGKKALAEASVIVREHTPLTNLFMCLWFNEVVRFTSRDQLSFPYVLWRLKVLKNINMFPVCTRKDLVNSMGHIRKAKPLIT
ncbi:probable hexosyltransferase MUCI70 isoform X2 [Corylus avellana]|uniref:probable hexosyltransferase MUCI70 isoform X2 n=1 Tax=Corylus avellana TaxID=13451 RepID=UPI00286AB6B8|nr:probable hexosyltransferase MUCI70 isoform X2 [Corylus avellana]